MWTCKQLVGFENNSSKLTGLSGASQERVGEVASGDVGASSSGSGIGRGRLRDCRVYSKRWPPLVLHIISRDDHDSTARLCSARPVGVENQLCAVMMAARS